MGISPKAHFRFTQLRRLSSVHSLSPEGRQACSLTQNNQTCYCIHIKVTLGEEGHQSPASHRQSGTLIADMFQDGLKEMITKAVVLALGEAILFLGRQSCKEGSCYTSSSDIGFSLTGPVNWAGRTEQVEVTVNTVQEAH